jgi:oxygen-independent coproporphyrinogen-3 oxidase
MEAGFSAEITVECAPGQLSGETLEAMQREGVNRLSFGVQSFVDEECAAVGRLHTGAHCREALREVAAAGVKRVGVDLICGLPHQTEASWRYTVTQALESGVEHVSVYMLEVDEGSRLGREALSGGVRYGAGALPEEDRVADWYAAGCEWLAAGGVRQYEISNFARAGGESVHNRKYWERKPYLGFGMDAHSMLRAGGGGVRWANADEMSAYVGRLEFERKVERVSEREGFEESLFLGLRLVEGVDLAGLDEELVGEISAGLAECEGARLVERVGRRVRLTGSGRMASNEVFGRLLVGANA